MISFAQSLPVGNAARIVMAPPEGAVRWRLLRKSEDDFTGHDDAHALVVMDGDERSVVDRQTLLNGFTYHYKLYWTANGADWTATPTVAVAVASTYQEVSEDVLMLVRERIDLGLQEEIRRDELRHPRNRIRCMTAFPWSETDIWPVVTVHLSSAASEVRGIGEVIAPDEMADEVWEEGEGWFERVQLDVIGWSQNPDERQALRRSIRRIILANLPVFDDAGFLNVDLRQTDAEEPGDRNTIIYKSIGSFSCLAPVKVTGTIGSIEDVEVTATPSWGG